MIEITRDEFNELSRYIQSHYGIYLKKEKQSLINARLSGILEQHSFRNFSEYYDYVQSDPTGQAVVLLIDKITTNYTFFLREAEHFTYLKEQVLPLWEKKSTTKDFRIWSAGCSSGQEPYTLAFILDEYFRDKPGWSKKVLATDISSQMLKTAKQGIYSEESMENIPKIWRLKYFQKNGEHRYEVSDHIKSEVLFSRFNLMSPEFSFKKKLHVIFCRNVMIYFDQKTKEELVRKFSEATESGGFLFISHTESLQGIRSDYEYVRPAVYRKK